MKKTEGQSLSELLERGRKATLRLAPATDKLTETIAQIERALAALRLGTEAHVDLPTEEEIVENGTSSMEVEHLRQLSFRKQGKTWRLFIDLGMHGNPWEEILLVNASRELRLEAVDYLPDLVVALVEKSEQTVAEVEAKQGAAEKILASLVQGREDAP